MSSRYSSRPKSLAVKRDMSRHRRSEGKQNTPGCSPHVVPLHGAKPLLKPGKAARHIPRSGRQRRRKTREITIRRLGGERCPHSGRGVGERERVCNEVVLGPCTTGRRGAAHGRPALRRHCPRDISKALISSIVIENKRRAKKGDAIASQQSRQPARGQLWIEGEQ